MRLSINVKHGIQPNVDKCLIRWRLYLYRFISGILFHRLFYLFLYDTSPLIQIILPNYFLVLSFSRFLLHKRLIASYDIRV